MTILVLGLGNPILTDDGVGVRVARLLRAALPPDCDVEVDEVSVGGLRLMERMVGHRRVLIVDALLSGTAPPGTVRRLTLDDLRQASDTRHSRSPHDADLVTALDLGRRAGMTVPEEVVFVAVEVENVVDFGEEPTPAVAAAIPLAAAAARREIDRWLGAPASDT